MSSSHEFEFEKGILPLSNSNSKSQTPRANKGARALAVPSGFARGLLRPCFARLLTSFVGQPDASHAPRNLHQRHTWNKWPYSAIAPVPLFVLDGRIDVIKKSRPMRKPGAIVASFNLPSYSFHSLTLAIHLLHPAALDIKMRDNGFQVSDSRP